MLRFIIGLIILYILTDADTQTSERVLNILRNQLSANMYDEYLDEIRDNVFITKFSSIEGYFFSPEILVNHKIFETDDELYQLLQEKLSAKKSKIINYFKEHNSGDDARIKKFEEEYNDKVLNIKDNIEWMKCKVRGHTYFGFTRSGTISWSDYVDELTSDTFKDLLTFFDSIPYFYSKNK